MWLTPLSTHFCSARALWAPVMMITTSRALDHVSFCMLDFEKGLEWPYIEDGADADGQCHARHFAHVTVEEARVGEHGVVRERLYASARAQARARFVECDVAVGTNSAKEELDATVGFDLCFIGSAFDIQIRGIAVQDIDIARVNVDV